MLVQSFNKSNKRWPMAKLKMMQMKVEQLQSKVHSFVAIRDSIGSWLGHARFFDPDFFIRFYILIRVNNLIYFQSGRGRNDVLVVCLVADPEG